MENVMDLMRLEGKTAIVTGGSGLYGRQMVIALAQAGATVYTASRNLKKNEAFASSLREQGLKVYAECFDQGIQKSIEDFSKRMEERGKIDILVNNSVLRCFPDYNAGEELFNESLRVNGAGAFFMCRVFGNRMAKNGGGSIINIGSYMGFLGPDDTLYKDIDSTKFPSPDYFFHKGGLTNLTRYIASLYGPANVRCNILELGGLFNSQNPLFVERYNARTFLKRMANNTDIMGAIVFLASDASAYITGTAIPVDGGYSAK